MTDDFKEALVSTGNHLGASDSKSLEFPLVPLTKDGGTYFKALTVFLFPKIVYLPFF